MSDTLVLGCGEKIKSNYPLEILPIKKYEGNQPSYTSLEMQLGEASAQISDIILKKIFA